MAENELKQRLPTHGDKRNFHTFDNSHSEGPYADLPNGTETGHSNVPVQTFEDIDVLGKDEEESGDELIDIHEEGHTIKLASASVDMRFFRRLGRIMRLSGTNLISRPHLYLWLVLFFSGLFSYLVSILTIWYGSLAGTLLELAAPINRTGNPFLQNVTSLDYGPVWDLFPYGFGYAVSLGVLEGLLNLLQYLLAWHWRKNITTQITNRYIQGTNPWVIVYMKKYCIDNPDQRIVRDIDTACLALAKIIVVATKSLAVLGYISYNFWMLGWEPVLIIYGISIFLAIIYKMILPPLAKYTFKQDHMEGDFRYAHARLRDYAEAIAFYEGEEMERQNTNKTLNAVLLNQKQLSKWMSLFLVYNGFNQYVPQMATAFINAIFLWRKTELSPAQLGSAFSEASSYCSSIMIYVALIVALGSDVATLAGNVGRIAQLLELTTYLNSTPEKRRPLFRNKDYIKFNQVTCITPLNTTLVRNLKLEITKGQHLLIMGPSGCGKSSLLRSLVGLWKCEGTISKPSKLGRGGVFYLPQKPYIVKGTLRDQITYPHQIPNQHDAGLYSHLEKANIAYLHRQHGGWDQEQDWYQILSPGELQRLMFARLFYHRPDFAVLDESTSALDSKNERHMYKQCLENDITLISVGHRNTLKRFHKILLRFDGKGGYTTEKISNDEKEIIAEEFKIIDKQAGTIDLHTPDKIIKNPYSVVEDEEGYFKNLFRLWGKMHGHRCCSLETLLLIILLVSTTLLAAFLATYPLLITPTNDAFIKRDLNQFAFWYSMLTLMVVILGLLVPIGNSAALFLGIKYRKNLVNYVHDMYFKRDQILKINTIEKDLDNPDQRITSSITDITTNDLVGNPGILGSFIVLSLSPITQFFLLYFDPYGGPISFLIVFGVTVLGLIIGTIFTIFIAKTTFTKAQKEGDFRFAHIKLREYAESICFNGDLGINKESIIIKNSFKKVLSSSWNWIQATVAFSMYISILTYLATPISSAIIIYALTKLDLTMVSQSYLYGVISTLAVLISGTITSSLKFIAILGPIANNKGHTRRVSQLIQRMKIIAESDPIYQNWERGERTEDEYIQFRDVVCVTPTGRVLNQPALNATITKEDRLILMGPSGCGKSSLLRVLAQLWPLESGEIVSPPKRDLFFLPQKPYMVLGTLRDQVMYPHSMEAGTLPTDIELSRFLDMTNLSHLLERFQWDEVQIWSSVLSPGEQQRLAFARLFYHSPKFAALDEATSALDPENEDLMYKMCVKQGIGIISVGHRESLVHHHNLLLRYDGFGGYELNETTDWYTKRIEGGGH